MSTVPNNLNIDPEISKLVKNMFNNRHNYVPPEPIKSVLIIDLRDSSDVNKIRLDCEKLTKYGLGTNTLGLNKYNREDNKYIIGITIFEYLNIKFDSFEYSLATINKLIELYEEVWLISYNSKEALEIKNNYYKTNLKVIEKWNLHSCTYEPDSIFDSDMKTSAFITNTIADKIGNIINQFV